MGETTEGKGLNRRGFLKGAVLGAGTVALVSVGAGKAAAARIPNRWDREADVVVVGFGGTGAAAALEAHDNGAKVLIIEKAPMAGGSTAISGSAS